MYEYEGLSDMFFIMLYGGATMMAVLAGLYGVSRSPPTTTIYPISSALLTVRKTS